jgi:hypothetical protein
MCGPDARWSGDAVDRAAMLIFNDAGAHGMRWRRYAHAPRLRTHMVYECAGCDYTVYALSCGYNKQVRPVNVVFSKSISS